MRSVVWGLAIFGLVWVGDVVYEEKVKMSAFNRAVSFWEERGIINMGATGNWLVSTTRKIARHPAIEVNVDMRADSTPKFFYLNLEQTPYPWSDKQFDVAFCSHILEHLENWREALAEWVRIADHVIIVLPFPYLHGWFSPAHKQHFLGADIEEMRQLGVEVFY